MILGNSALQNYVNLDENFGQTLYLAVIGSFDEVAFIIFYKHLQLLTKSTLDWENFESTVQLENGKK